MSVQESPRNFYLLHLKLSSLISNRGNSQNSDHFLSRFSLQKNCFAKHSETCTHRCFHLSCIKGAKVRALRDRDVAGVAAGKVDGSICGRQRQRPVDPGKRGVLQPAGSSAAVLSVGNEGLPESSAGVDGNDQEFSFDLQRYDENQRQVCHVG